MSGVLVIFVFFFFFFKQKTAYEMRISDWSSDVCSSDLFEFRPHAEQSLGLVGEGETRALHHLQSRLGGAELGAEEGGAALGERVGDAPRGKVDLRHQRARRCEQGGLVARRRPGRAEERRVGEEWVRTCKYRWWP